jgi:hypothetical protein
MNESYDIKIIILIIKKIHIPNVDSTGAEKLATKKFAICLIPLTVT